MSACVYAKTKSNCLVCQLLSIANDIKLFFCTAACLTADIITILDTIYYRQNSPIGHPDRE
jgi:hypothetical protein